MPRPRCFFASFGRLKTSFLVGVATATKASVLSLVAPTKGSAIAMTCSTPGPFARNAMPFPGLGRSARRPMSSATTFGTWRVGPFRTVACSTTQRSSVAMRSVLPSRISPLL
ncbi:MAG: hypothetical protein KGJ23_13980 [Euryarchaeota archaeon]|nr:hypothetical protein [Euryarchaeota archaeon]MDE1837707.1 hypothetical protein [Euryarchaeota archaeon]MDE1881734.1 hypothetical protein [Euryarchaeota archaeon]MDE2045963.1 hypothetical protein [Thermoplasmata archaeon]